MCPFPFFGKAKHSTPRWVDRLRQFLPESAILTDPADRWSYGYDNSREHVIPDAVVFPANAGDVQTCVQLCNELALPVLARGRGTGTAGAAVPVRGGLVLAMERMNRILAVDPANRVMVVEPGVTNQAVQDAAAVHGFFGPPIQPAPPFVRWVGTSHAILLGHTQSNTVLPVTIP